MKQLSVNVIVIVKTSSFLSSVQWPLYWSVLWQAHPIKSWSWGERDHNLSFGHFVHRKKMFAFFSLFENFDFWGLGTSFSPKQGQSFGAAWRPQKLSDLAEILHDYPSKRANINPNEMRAIHWLKTFENFLRLSGLARWTVMTTDVRFWRSKRSKDFFFDVNSKWIRGLAIDKKWTFFSVFTTILPKNSLKRRELLCRNSQSLDKSTQTREIMSGNTVESWPPSHVSPSQAWAALWRRSRFYGFVAGSFWIDVKKKKSFKRFERQNRMSVVMTVQRARPLRLKKFSNVFNQWIARISFGLMFALLLG